MNIKMSDVFELPVEYRKVDGEPMLGDKNYHLVSFCDALTYEDGKGGERADYASVAINAYDSNQALIAKQQQTIDEQTSEIENLKNQYQVDMEAMNKRLLALEALLK